VASAADIDTGMKLGTNWPMGPLAVADIVGLDTTKAILESLERELGDARYRPAGILGELIAAGKLGRKSGAGFFDYGR
jgi:3-hydroxybutyryl-CoA dehydrogenase